MTGENGTPATPDWTPEPHSLVLSGEDFDRLIAELDKPPAVNEALHQAVIRARRFEWLDDPEHIERGTN